MLALVVVVSLLLGVAGTALAADFRGGDTILIGKGEVIDDDLVITAATVLVEGAMNGDLVIAAGEVTINGTVNGSLLVGARSLLLNGTVRGALYNGGAMLTLGPQARVERNLFFGGYSFEAKPGSVIQRDGVLGAYQATLNGALQRDLNANLVALQVNGMVGGDVNATVAGPQEPGIPPIWLATGGQNLPPTLSPGIRVGSDAQIAGRLNYSSPVDQAEAIAAQAEQGVLYTPLPAARTSSDPTTPAAQPENPILGWLWLRFRELVTLLLLGALALWLAPALFTRVVDTVWAHPLPAAVWGFVASTMGYIGAALLIILLTLVIVGLSQLTLAGLAMSLFWVSFTGLGALLTAFTLLLAYGAKLVVIFPIGRWLLAQIAPEIAAMPVWPLLLGVLLFVLLHGIPYLGFVVGLIVTLIGLGAMWLSLRDRFTKAATPKLVLAPT